MVILHKQSVSCRSYIKKFIQTIHEGNADRYLVALLQDRGRVDKEKINKIDDNDVSLNLDIIILISQMKPSQ